MLRINNSNRFEIYELDWDTQYFGISSAKAILKESLSENEINLIINYLSNYEFNTIINCNNDPKNNYWVGNKTNAFLTDINVQFTKQVLQNEQKIKESYKIYDIYQRDTRVLDIAYNSFVYSRFFNDNRLPKDKAKNIYVHWAESAFEKNNQYFILAEDNSKLSGFLLFMIDKNNLVSTIELIAVDSIYRGQNIGKTLINNMEYFVCKKGINLIKVGTQVNNISAIKFYAKNGFKYAGSNAIYHYWP
jgi:ribosomal protein S18 acetylase RimI-like enzyme